MIDHGWLHIAGIHCQATTGHCVKFLEYFLDMCHIRARRNVHTDNILKASSRTFEGFQKQIL